MTSPLRRASTHLGSGEVTHGHTRFASVQANERCYSMTIIPFGPWEPDKSRFNSGAMATVINALPVADGWAPLQSIESVVPSGAVSGVYPLPYACLSAYYVKNTSGTERYFAFTANRIYEFNKTDFGWNDVTRASGGTYSATDRWSVALFGSRLYAQNGVDAEQWIDVDSGTKFANNSTAPIARYIATVGDFMVRGCPSGVLNKIQWSAINDPTSNTVGVNGCDEQVFAEGQELTGIIPMSFGAIIALRDAFYSMNFALQSEYVFTFQPISLKKGTSAPWSIVLLNQDDFILYCGDGFARGAQFQPVGALRVDQWFADNSTESGRRAMTAVNDPFRKVVWFSFLDSSEVKKWLGYNWQLDRWFLSDMDAQCLFRATTLSVTIDGLASYYATIDAISAPYDSPLFDGGTPSIAGISATGALGFLAGTNMAASFETNEMSLNGSNRATVNGGRLIGDAVDVSVVLSTADYQGQDLTARSAITPSSRTRFLSLRGDGRVHKIAASIAAGADWSIVSGIDLDIKATGRS